MEDLHAPRTQMADAEAIYFIEPSTKNIDALLKDFDMITASYKPANCCERLLYWGDVSVPSVKSNKYGKVHLIFQGAINEQLFARIK